jgi:hypothetical protein
MLLWNMPIRIEQWQFVDVCDQQVFVPFLMKTSKHLDPKFIENLSLLTANFHVF